MKKGFTLVEMLAVITIIGLLALLTIPAIDSIIRENKETVYELQEKQMIDALKEYAATNALILEDTNTLTLYELKTSGLIEKNLRNPKTNECFADNIELKITRKNNTFEYEIDRDTISFCGSADEDCTCTN